MKSQLYFVHNILIAFESRIYKVCAEFKVAVSLNRFLFLLSYNLDNFYLILYTCNIQSRRSI